MDTIQFKVKQTFTTQALGTAPADKEVLKNFIASKRAEAEERRKKAAERMGVPAIPVAGTEVEEIETISEEKGLTVFHSDLGKRTETGEEGKGLFMFDYQIMGQWKEAAEILADIHGVKQVRSKLDNLLCVKPRRIYFHDAAGKHVERANDRLERPLRAMTMQGPRVSLVSSELLEPGCWIEYVADFLPFLKAGSGKEAKKIDIFEFSKLVLSLGERRGTLQWRNGGWGRFAYTIESLSPGFEKK